MVFGHFSVLYSLLFAASDYVPHMGHVIIPPKARYANVTVEIQPDTLIEGNENFYATITTDDSLVEINSGSRAQITIIDDDSESHYAMTY